MTDDLDRRSILKRRARLLAAAVAAAGLASTTAASGDVLDGGTSETEGSADAGVDADVGDASPDGGEGQPQVCLCAVSLPGARRR